MKYKYVLFDLDGTITDPFDGITASIIYALDKFGISVPDRKELAAFIGPPLVDSFSKYYGFSHGCSLAAVGYYREYYGKKGIFECTLYDGIADLFHKLKDSGVKVIIATSEPEHFAIKLMEHFGIDGCFASICGATMDEKRTNKDEVIRYALDRNGIKNTDECIMVGDRKYDVLGAKSAGIKSVGVLYGYGSRDEMDAAAPDFIAESVAELEKILM
ncbi:MAG: HAD-IA family hydrolase [Clostridia bacterium]|nr:HAD-IA family hydrolase [Clostridia bacterium]